MIEISLIKAIIVLLAVFMVELNMGQRWEFNAHRRGQELFKKVTERKHYGH